MIDLGHLIVSSFHVVKYVSCGAVGLKILVQIKVHRDQLQVKAAVRLFALHYCKEVAQVQKTKLIA